MGKVLIFLLLFVPTLAQSAGLVPCGGLGEDPCQACHVTQLINLVTQWLSVILFTVLSIVIVVMGLRMASSVGEVEAQTQAKKIISTAIIGYIIFLAASMIVDFAMKVTVDDAIYGFWNDIQCVEQPIPQLGARQTASGDSSIDFSSSPSAVSNEVNSIQSSGAVRTDIINAATNNGILDDYQVRVFQALVAQESNNCSNKVGQTTGVGTAYGCAQMLVSTARGVDSDLASLSDEEVKNKLIEDDSYALALGAKYYAQLYERYGRNTDLALAAYNGGALANQPSNDCPGEERWRCEWDSPGCYDGERSDCIPNTGYKETRNYVNNIKIVADRLK